jgi:hypothetical protein
MNELMNTPFTASQNTEEAIAAQLERIEAKLDAILEKLKWAPQSMAQWYATTTQGGVPEQELEQRQDPDRH